MQLKEIKNIYHKELDQHYPKEEVDSFFYILTEHYLGLERFASVLAPDLIISKDEEQPMFKALGALKQAQPVQYIVGKTCFMEMDFLVEEEVLIPRPETEELVCWVLEEIQSEKYEVRNTTDRIKILDIGTGSGCIAISLAKYIGRSQVYALDISWKALEIAKKNSELNGVEIEFLQLDILNPVPIDLRFDIMVSNPPYIRELEKRGMHKNVTGYEPHMALFVPDENPLIFYEAIAQFAKANLTRNGILFLEINQYLGKETKALLRKHNFSEIELRKDMYGNDRMIKCSVG